METPSEDPVESVSAGVAKGVLSWTEEKIKGLIVKFHNRDIAFVEDPETINLAKKQRKTSEWAVFKQYVDDPDLRILFQMGLTLRRLEKHQKPLESLREKIKNKYHLEGLHIAQFFQNGFFLKHYTHLLESGLTSEELEVEIPNLLGSINRTVVWIAQADNEEIRIDEIVTKIHANSPKTLIICSTKSAMGKCESIKKKVMKRIIGYDVELYKTDIKEIYFLNRKEI